jgi:hypothetical protein
MRRRTEETGALIARIAETKKPKARYVAPFHAMIMVDQFALDRGARPRLLGYLVNEYSGLVRTAEIMAAHPR